MLKARRRQAQKTHTRISGNGGTDQEKKRTKLWTERSKLFCALGCTFLAALFRIHSLSISELQPTPLKNNHPAAAVAPLQELTASSAGLKGCPPDRRVAQDYVISAAALPLTKNSSFVVPPILHQSGSSRCVPPKIYEIVDQWREVAARNKASYYYHDDHAVRNLLQSENIKCQFPHLPDIVKCAVNNEALNELWRYVVLWEYGGLYIHSDLSPGDKFDLSNILENDGFFLKTGGNELPIDFMAVSPKHPLLYHAVHIALWQLWKNWAGTNIANIEVDKVTGWRGTFSKALWEFTSEQQLNRTGVFIGFDQRSFRVALSNSELSGVVKENFVDVQGFDSPSPASPEFFKQCIPTIWEQSN